MLNFSLPQVTDIEIPVEGRMISGAYSVVLGDLVVYYNGHTSSVRKPETNVEETALRMLHELVREHYVQSSRVPTELPEPIREAATAYANSFDDDEPIRDLIEAFGPAPVGSEAHARISWLCVNALQPVVPCWKAICDEDAAERMLAQWHQWLKDDSLPVDWEAARQPLTALRDGIRIEDCDACRVEPIAKALATCADYLQTAEVNSAVETIFQAWGAHSEGCWPSDEERPYEQWLIEVALPAAHRCQAIL